MRRYISYLAMCATMLLGVGASAVPMIKAADADLAYADGKTLYFKASHYVEDSPNSNYSDFLDDSDINNDKPVIDLIADEFRVRLEKWGLSEFEVATQGYDTIAVTLRTPGNDSLQYSYLEQYLAFSGGDYELDASDTSFEDYAHPDILDDIIDGQTAEIKDIDMGSYKVPVVVVPLKEGDDYREAFLNLVKYCTDHTSAAETDDDGNETKAAVSTTLVVWANRQETDDYSKSRSDINQNGRILTVNGTANDNSVWYDPSDTDKKTPYLQLIPPSEAISESNYDPTKTKQAVAAATFLCNMFNASSYHSMNNGAGYHVNFTYALDAKATVESLITFGDWAIEASFGRTLLATIVLVVVLGVVLGLAERIFAFTHMANALAASAASLALFIAFGAQLNIAAIIGLIAPMAVSLFGSLYYSRNLKNEIYRGRTLKKAHQEAIKKSVWPTVDAGVVSIIIGVFVYVFAGDLASKVGIMLVVGGFFGALVNLIFTRIGGWLLCNDNTMQSKFPKQFLIDQSKIPDLVKEEQQSFFGTYAERDFSKGKLWTSIVSGAFVLAGLVTMIIFGVKDGIVFNNSEYTAPSTVLRLDIRSDNNDIIPYEGVSTIDELRGNDVDGEPNLLAGFKVTIDGKQKTLDSLTTAVTLSETPYSEHITEDAGDGTNYYWRYYEISLKKYFDPANDYEVSYYIDGHWTDPQTMSLDEAIDSFINSKYIYEAENFTASFKTTIPEVSEPKLSKLSLGIGVGLAVAMVYMMLRYRPSRGIAATAVALVASYGSVAFFAFTRIPAMPTVAISAAVVAVIAFLVSLFAMAGEKDLIRESHEKDKSGYEFRGEMLRTATSRNAGAALLLAALALWMGVIFFALSTPYYQMSYLCFIIGLALALTLALTTMPFVAMQLGKLFSKIKIKPLKKKKKAQAGQLLKRKKSGEPEEAIFIGIND